LNGFKAINDNLGHQAGDDLLKQFAAELRYSMRATDIVGRMGGDEFVGIMTGPLDAVRERVEQVKQRVNGDYPVMTDRGKKRVPMSAAVGIAEWKQGRSAVEVLRDADTLMYEDKKRGRAAR